MSHESVACSNRTFEEIQNIEWWLRRVATCRRLRSLREFASGCFFILACLLAIYVLYLVTLYEESDVPLELGNWLALDKAQVSFVAALLSGFVMGRVYDSPSGIMRKLLAWRRSWLYNFDCLKVMIDETVAKLEVNEANLNDFERAAQDLYRNWDRLKDENAFRGKTSPQDKLRAVLEPFVSSLRNANKS